MQDQTGESRAYVPPRKAAEAQRRFDKTFEKTKTLSFLPPQITAMGGPATAVHTVPLPELASAATSDWTWLAEGCGHVAPLELPLTVLCTKNLEPRSWRPD